MSEEEQTVIEQAVHFIQTWKHGLYKDRDRALEDLTESVEALLVENDGKWPNE